MTSPGAIALEAEGLRHPRALRFLGDTVTPYADNSEHLRKNTHDPY